MNEYREVAVTTRAEPLEIAGQLAKSGVFSKYVVYERHGRWYVAGDPLGEVAVDAGAVRSTLGGSHAEPWQGTPWRQVNAALERTPVDGWNAYGWASFELASGGPADGPLAYLMVPSVEIELADGGALIRGVDDLAVHKVREQLRTSPAFHHRPANVDIGGGADAYRRRVSQAVQRIREGLLHKVILSRTVDVPFPVDLPATYVLGRRANTPARSFLLDLGGWRAAGFSPETVAEVSGSTVSTQPLAGTCARTGDEATDARLRAQLEADPKEVFEHATSVKLAFDELAAVGTATRVSEFLAVRPRGSVHHLASRVDTTLADGRTAWDAFGAVFPAVTASGIPKRAAYELIGEQEDEPRGLYAGAVLRAGSDGSLDAALVLRAVFQRAGRSWLRAGAGIVVTSRPEREYEETCEKLRSVAPYLVPEGQADVQSWGVGS